MKSIQEKRSLVDQLAVKIGYHSNIALNDNDINFVWSLIDFGYPEDNIIQDKCSLQASLDFNIDTWEKQIDNDIIRLQNILKGYK
jgi:hypothetical protein